MNPDVDSDLPVAVVTGAGGGIGSAIAARLAEDGFHVVALDIALLPTTEIMEPIGAVLFAGFATLVLLPWHAADAQIPLVIRILLSVSPLIYYPIWGGIRPHAHRFGHIAAGFAGSVALGRLERRTSLGEEYAHVSQSVRRGTRARSAGPRSSGRAFTRRGTC